MAPDTTKPAKITEAKTESVPAEAPALAPASETSNPEVHRLLAELQSARLNEDADAIQSYTDQINALGFSA